MGRLQDDVTLHRLSSDEVLLLELFRTLSLTNRDIVIQYAAATATRAKTLLPQNVVPFRRQIGR